MTPAPIAHRAAVLGDPVDHSRSPQIHNAGYAALGLDDWPLLAPPAGFGPLNAPVLATLDDADLRPALARWAAEVWDAWQEQHRLVRSWTDVALAGRRG